MSPEQQLIDQIRQTLSTRQLENRNLLMEQADMFADICRLANERLLRCADYLSKGRRSEAVYEAHLAPDLLNLANQLSGEWMKQWQNVIADLALTPYQPLNQEVIAQLREACSSEESLEPLLKEYRRCVYQNDHLKCIDLLRKIRQRDPANDVWGKNLRPLEEEYLPYWISRAEHGLETMDLTDLKVVFAELSHPSRAVPPPEELMKRLRKALLSERAIDLETDGEMLLAKVKHAMEQEDMRKLEELWEQGAVLEADEAFYKRPEGWDTVLAASHALQERLARQESQRQAFEESVSQLKDVLMDPKMDPVKLRHDYERLETFGLPIPSLLVRQVNEILTLRRRGQHRKVLLSSLGILVLTALVAGVILWHLHSRHVAAERADWLAKAERYEEGQRLEELETLLEEIRQADAVYYESSQLAGIQERLAQARRLQEQNQKRYEAYVATLKQIREGGYRGDKDAIWRTLEDAKAVAQTTEQKNCLLRWRDEWLRFKQQEEADIDGTFAPLLNSLQVRLEGIREGRDTELDNVQIELEKLQRDFLALPADKIACGSEKLRKAHGDMKARLANRLVNVGRRQQAHKRHLAQQKQNEERLAAQLNSLKQALPKALPNLVRYEALLKDMVKLGSEQPWLSDYRTILDNMGSYRGVVALSGGLPPDPLCSAAVESTVNTFLSDSNPAHGSIWRGDLERVRRLCAVNRELQNRISNLVDLRKDKLYMLKFRRHGDQHWQRLYSPRPFQNQQKDGTVYYWGTAYWAMENESQASLTSTSAINHGVNISSQDFEVIHSRIPNDSLAPHVKFMRRILAESSQSPDVPALVLEELDKLRQEQDMDPIQGFLIFKRLVNLLAKHCQEDLPEAAQWADKANAIETDVPWQRETHPRTQQARQKVADFWKTIPALSPYRRRLDLNKQLLQAVLRTELRCVGSVQQNPKNGEKVYRPCAQATEYWILKPADNGLLSSFTLLPEDGKGGIAPQALNALALGTPVFGPLPGRELTGFVHRLKLENPDLLESLKLPRTLPEIPMEKMEKHP